LRASGGKPQENSEEMRKRRSAAVSPTFSVFDDC
jgi:hypothetical protein